MGLMLCDITKEKKNGGDGLKKGEEGREVEWNGIEWNGEAYLPRGAETGKGESERRA